MLWLCSKSYFQWPHVLLRVKSKVLKMVYKILCHLLPHLFLSELICYLISGSHCAIRMELPTILLVCQCAHTPGTLHLLFPLPGTHLPKYADIPAFIHLWGLLLRKTFPGHPLYISMPFRYPMPLNSTLFFFQTHHHVTYFYMLVSFLFQSTTRTEALGKQWVPLVPCFLYLSPQPTLEQDTEKVLNQYVLGKDE